MRARCSRVFTNYLLTSCAVAELREVGARDVSPVPGEVGARDVSPVPGEVGARDVSPVPGRRSTTRT